MAPLDWPRPPNIDGLSIDDAVSATQAYARQVQGHMDSLHFNTTEYGVLIGFTLSALSNATKILDVVYQKPDTGLDIRNNIEEFGSAMQSLTSYMENVSAMSDSISSAPEGIESQTESMAHKKANDSFELDESSDTTYEAPAAEQEGRTVYIEICNEDPTKPELMAMSAEQLRSRLVQDLQGQGIRVPLLSAEKSSNGGSIRIFTSSKYNAAILRNPGFWKPSLFGENAHVLELLPGENRAGEIDASSSNDLAKMRKAEKKARKNARLVWIMITDRILAKEVLIGMDNSQLKSMVEQDIQAQNIKLRIERCKKSHACNHIRVWTASTKDVSTLSDKWIPTLFGKGAYVRWQKTRNTAILAAPVTQEEAHREDVESSTGLSEVPDLTSRETRRAARKARQICREIFIEMPDRQHAKFQLVGMKSRQLKALAREDLKVQGIAVQIAGCKIVESGTHARIRIRTKSPEEAEYLKQPGRWTPRYFGEGAHVVTQYKRETIAE
ncbi:MAG: hypothetical protein Q9209_005439 [Squamulea sp. 1 TL-2023]